MTRYLLLTIFLIFLVPLLSMAQQEGLLSKIENPKHYFEGERKDWVGKTIRFLRCKNANRANPYFDWYYDPFNLLSSKPKREELMYRYGVIREVWLGQVHIEKWNKNYWRMGFFWKVQLKHNDRYIYFWDDGEAGVFNFGFVEDMQNAKSHEGEKLWAKKQHFLYKMDDSGTIPVKNLEPVKLIAVEWGEYGNFPLKFILTNQAGQKGYLIYKNYDQFVENWFTYNPKEKFPEFVHQDWKYIENRTLRTGMSPQMVQLCWGEPSKIETQYDEKGRMVEIWTYEGVRETTYYVQFQNNQLENVWWKNKK